MDPSWAALTFRLERPPPPHIYSDSWDKDPIKLLGLTYLGPTKFG